MTRITVLFLSMISIIFSPHSSSIIKNEDISFDRELMSIDRQERRVEGYWADGGHGSYPFPKANIQPWNGKEIFLKKLESIELLANVNGRIILIEYRGWSLSRLEPGTIVGTAEFADTQANIAWPDGLRQHYFDKFNVLPSREFYKYVMEFPV